MEEPRGLYTRGYLPHWELGSVTQFVTFRLGDSLPAEVLLKIQEETALLPEGDRKRERYRRFEAHLDVGHGSAILRNPVAAIALQNILLAKHPNQCKIDSWVIMPNHAHVILKPEDGYELGKIVGQVKGASSREIHRLLGGSGQLWQIESFDRLIRDEDHLLRVRRYIEWNPVKAKLCKDPKEWPYSSANPIALAKLADRERQS